MNSPRDPRSPRPNDLSHAFELYEKARFLYAKFRPFNETTAEMLIMTASDAIKEFGNTNQDRKVELRKMIKEAEAVLPPETLAELQKRLEKMALGGLHPKSPGRRKVFYLVAFLILLCVPAAVYFAQFFKPGADSARVAETPTPTHTSPRPVETPNQFTTTPTPVQQAPPVLLTSPTPGTGEVANTNANAAPPSDRQPLRNYAAPWVRLSSYMEWRVVAVQPLANATRLYIEIRNTHEQQENDFYAFASYPLVIIDGDGGFHKMLQTSEAPEGVRESYKHWYLQAGRVIRVAADFKPLGPGVLSGQVVYETNNRADPAKFSLSQ